VDKSTDTNASFHARRLAATPRGVAVSGQFYAQRALNSELWDIEGRRYIDFAGGIAVLNTGHAHPRVSAAIAQQLGEFTHTCFQVVPYSGYVKLAERINQLVPGQHAKKTALFSTGVEAVENAVKIARAATGRSAVIAFTGAFHGRSLLGMGLTGKVFPYKHGFGPMPAELYHATFPDPLRGVTAEDALHALADLFKYDVSPERVAAILIEPVQGEGGFNVAPPELLRGVRALCDDHGIVMIADEIQAGFGRTGKMFAMEHSGVVPDLITMAKSLAGGMPLSAVCGRAELMDAPQPGGLGGTYAGNPLAVAAAHAVLDVIEDEKLCARAQLLGDRLKARLNGLRARVPAIADVRGLGSMVAVEFCAPGTQTPDAAIVTRVQQRALELGLIVLTCGIYGNVIRFLYPLTCPDTVFGEAMDMLEQALLESSSVH
jgi:4-aminobutyrate aminotransferase